MRDDPTNFPEDCGTLQLKAVVRLNLQCSLTDAPIFSMVAFVCQRMVGAVSRIQDASRLLFVGTRDWTSLNRWEKINVSV